MDTTYYPLFRKYNEAVVNWLRTDISTPIHDASIDSILYINKLGTTGGGVNQHEIELDDELIRIGSKDYPIDHVFKSGHIIEIKGSTFYDGRYSIDKVVGRIIILDRTYKSFPRAAPVTKTYEEYDPNDPNSIPRPTVQKKINVIYGNIDRAVATIAQPLRNGTIDNPGISVYITDFQYKIEKSRPPENTYTKHITDPDTGVVVGVAKVPPMQEYQVAYSINIWSAYQQEIDLLLYQILGHFKPSKYWWIGNPEFGMEYDGDRMDRQHNGQWAHSLLETASDASDLEPGDATQRTLRYEISFMITNAYLPMAYESDQKMIGGIDIETLIEERLGRPYCN